MSDQQGAGDEHMGEFVYCTQHLRAHATGWCTVDPMDKVSLKAKTAEEAFKEAEPIDREERAKITAWRQGRGL